MGCGERWRLDIFDVSLLGIRKRIDILTTCTRPADHPRYYRQKINHIVYARRLKLLLFMCIPRTTINVRVPQLRNISSRGSGSQNWQWFPKLAVIPKTDSGSQNLTLTSPDWRAYISRTALGIWPGEEFNLYPRATINRC